MVKRIAPIIAFILGCIVAALLFAEEPPLGPELEEERDAILYMQLEDDPKLFSRPEPGVDADEPELVTEVRIHGTGDASVDTLIMEAATEALQYHGGTIYFTGELAIDKQYFTSGTPTTVSSIMLLGNEFATVNLIGENNAVLRLDNHTSLWWRGWGGARQYWTNGTPGAPKYPRKKMNSFFTVPDHGLERGDWVYIWSEHYDDWLEVHHGWTYKHLPGELVQVATVQDKDNFSTEAPVIDPMTTCLIRKMRPQISPRVENFTVKGLEQIGIRFIECRDPQLRNVNFAWESDLNAPYMPVIMEGNCNFTLENLHFAQSSHKGCSGAGCHIMLSGANSWGTIRNITSGATHHHLDTTAPNRNGLKDGDGKIYNSRIGTPRNILIHNWKAKQERRHNSSVIFNTHESSFGLTFDNCQVDMAGFAYGFGIRARNSIVRNCDVRGNGTGYAHIVTGPENSIIGGLVEHTYFGIVTRSRKTMIEGVRIKDCDVGVALTSSPNYSEANDAEIRNCVFDNFRGHTRSSSGPNSHLFIKAGLTGHRVTGNDMARGINHSAIHCEEFTPETFSLLQGNNIDGYGEILLASTAFQKGVFKSGQPSTVEHDLVAARYWGRLNNFFKPASHTTMYVTSGKQGIIENTQDFSNKSWVLTGLCNTRSTKDAWHCMFGQKGGDEGTGQRWLLAHKQAKRWATRLGGDWIDFEGLPPFEIGPLYEFRLSYNHEDKMLELMVNGVTSVVECTPKPATGDFVVGTGHVESTGWNIQGDIGVTFKAPGAQLTWPVTRGRQPRVIVPNTDLILP